ncbi:Uu.00g079650.m01.CDS01 [Anthostomella pinea]|uniref:Uu.00g079650.m01.CDS01 n=1 Tax=Anthostomella pinea TaxID=933095 RepID=A0AAI8YGU8_9PEZI|nr:Uu.00g079650.m01.CDS01 [Anthostomella pinea]
MFDTLRSVVFSTVFWIDLGIIGTVVSAILGMLAAGLVILYNERYWEEPVVGVAARWNICYLIMFLIWWRNYPRVELALYQVIWTAFALLAFMTYGSGVRWLLGLESTLDLDEYDIEGRVILRVKAVLPWCRLFVLERDLPERSWWSGV